MRLLIVGTLKGQLTTATKIAMDNGASVTHAEESEQAMRVLTQDGLLIISNNRKLFELDPVVSEIFAVENVSRWSLDPDFERSPDIHQCWFIRKK